jgi:hypothetical protein
MGTHHHPVDEPRCGCCRRCCGCRCAGDEDLWALGAAIVAPLVALGTVAMWAARRPAGALAFLALLLAVVAVALAVTA